MVHKKRIILLGRFRESKGIILCLCSNNNRILGEVTKAIIVISVKIVLINSVVTAVRTMQSR